MSPQLPPPEPPLADDLITLDPLTGAHVEPFRGMIDDDAIRRFTMVPSEPSDAFVAEWIDRYRLGWQDGSRAGFAIVARDLGVVGFAAIFGLQPETAEGEIGYFVGSQARGRGIASRAVDLLTRWGFDTLGLERIELRIDTENAGSATVAERAGYRLDGVLRSKYFKEGLRTDTGVWSRLRND